MELEYKTESWLMSRGKIVSGIYKIVNILDGKYYVGRSGNIRYRWNSHRYLLRENKHFNVKLQNAWNKYGESSFNFIVVYVVDEGSDIGIREKEDEYLAECKLDQSNNYNLIFSNDGFKDVCDESKKKLSIIRRGIKRSEETKEKMRKKMLNRFVSEETKEKQRLAATGRKMDRAAVEKIRSANIGRKWSAEHREKVMLSRKKTSWTQMKRVPSKNFTMNRKGKVNTPEHNVKISVGAENSWKQRKEQGKLIFESSQQVDYQI